MTMTSDLSEWAIVTLGRERRASDRARILGNPARATKAAIVDAWLTDPLTGAATRDGLVRCRPGDWVTLVDLDGFKAINDSLGHAAGDDVLTAVAARLATLGRVVRLGGDEFVVITGHALDSRAVVAVVEPAIVTLAGVVTVGASSGSARVAEGVDAALAVADAAMYVDKATRRPRAKLTTRRGS